MTDKPTFYGWLMKIAIILIVVVFAYLYKWIDKAFPGFKKTAVFRYAVTPLLYIIGFILVILFIA